MIKDQKFVVYFNFNAHDVYVARVSALNVELAMVRASVRYLTPKGVDQVRAVSVYVEGYEPGVEAVLKGFNDANSSRS